MKVSTRCYIVQSFLRSDAQNIETEKTHAVKLLSVMLYFKPETSIFFFSVHFDVRRCLFWCHYSVVTFLVMYYSILVELYDLISNRAQFVRHNQAFSEYNVLSGAVPQGTKLGLIGFQVVINNAAQDLGDKITCWKYVDDLTFAENCSFPQPSGMQVG